MRLKRWSSVILFAVISVAVILHAGYISNGFTWLDHGDIELGRSVLPPTRLIEAFTDRFGQTGFYRPLVTVANSLDFAVYGSWAPGFHLSNVILHLLAAVIAGIWARSYFGLDNKEASAVALVFFVHPLGWLPTGQISYRPELLYVLFSFAAIYFYVLSGKNRSGLFLALSGLLYLSALFSKETAILTVPSLIVLWELTSARKNPAFNLKSKAAPVIMYALITGLFIWLRSKAVPEIWKIGYHDLTVAENVGTRLSVLIESITSLSLPLRPVLSDAVKVVNVNYTHVIFLLAYFLLLFILLRRHFRSPVFKLFMFLSISLLPALNFVPLPRFHSPHYGYLAMAGVGVAYVLLSRKLGKANPAGKIFTVFAAVWLLSAMVSKSMAGRNFRNDLTLFSPEVKTDRRFAEGNQYLGDYYFKTGDYGQAKAYYEDALTKYPGVIAYVDRGAVMNNLAGVYLMTGDTLRAKKMLDGMLLASPADPMLVYNRAIVAADEGDWKTVIRLLDRKDMTWDRPEPFTLLRKAKESLSGSKE